jgi:hypothetical protein
LRVLYITLGENMQFKLWLESFQEIYKICMEAAALLHCEKGGVCPFFAEMATKKLLENNISNFLVVEGWVKGKNERFWRQHTWIEVEGQKIDPTFTQFSHLGKANYINRVKRRYNPQEYLELVSKHPEEEKYKGDYIK